jgi:uncharacterized membrane protein
MKPEYIHILITASVGSVLGTLLKSVTRPEPHFGSWLLQSFVALSVGILIGGAIAQYFHLEGFMSVTAGAVSAYLSEEAIKFLQARGRRLAHGELPLSNREGGEDA